MSKKGKVEIVSEQYFLSEEKQYEFCQDAVQLARGLKVGLMMLAEKLYRIERQKLYKSQYEHFYMFCDEIEMNTATASRLINVYEKFVMQNQIAFDDIKNLEYTKLYEIKKVADTKEVAMHWINQINAPEVENRLTLSALKIELKKLELGMEDEKCDHGNTYLVRCCRDCGEKWEEFPDTKNMTSEEKENHPSHKHAKD